MPLDGDFTKLQRWADALRRVAEPRARFRMADEMADRALGLVAEGFARETNPYGRRWAPKKRPDGRPILRGETNQLAQWRKRFVNQHGYAIASKAPYQGFHQSGTKFMSARMMTPGDRLPSAWVKEMRGVFNREMKRILR